MQTLFGRFVSKYTQPRCQQSKLHIIIVNVNHGSCFAVILCSEKLAQGQAKAHNLNTQSVTFQGICLVFNRLSRDEKITKVHCFDMRQSESSVVTKFGGLQYLLSETNFLKNTLYISTYVQALTCALQ